MSADVAKRAQRVLDGSIREAARLMRQLDDGDPIAEPVLDALYEHTGGADIVGVTGVPGAGKSTLVAQLIRGYRRSGRRVGVVAIDPSSPFTGGAILGDRVRMQQHATDPGVFIRSLATRGALGGLSRSTNAVIHVLDAMGFDVVIVETVGVGQDEIDIVRVAHTAVVVTVPGLGDEVQNLKAGIMEIADIFCVNKADRPDTSRHVTQLRGVLNLTHGRRTAWKPPIVQTVATESRGIDELIASIDRHTQHMRESGGRERRERARARAEIEAIAWSRVRDQLNQLMESPTVRRELEKVGKRGQTPQRVAAQLLSKVLGSTE